MRKSLKRASFSKPLLLAALALSSCGRSGGQPLWVEGFVTPALLEAVETFDTEIKDVGTSALTILFVPKFTALSFPKNSIALHYMNHDRVEILSQYQNHPKLEVIVFHEMGHWQGLEHDSSSENLMHPFMGLWYDWADPEVRASLMEDLRNRLAL